MKHRPLLLISAMLLLGQVAFAQAGKQIVTISHQYVNHAGCHEEATFEYDNHGRLLHARTLDYDDLGEENVWVTEMTIKHMLMGMPVDVAGAQAMMGLYDHMGWQTSAPRKGSIYIGNGRKVVSK